MEVNKNKHNTAPEVDASYLTHSIRADISLSQMHGILLQTSGDISNGTECFNRPDLLTGARAETVPHLCLAAARNPHKNTGPSLNSMIQCVFIPIIK